MTHPVYETNTTTVEPYPLPYIFQALLGPGDCYRKGFHFFIYFFVGSSRFFAGEAFFCRERHNKETCIKMLTNVIQFNVRRNRPENLTKAIQSTVTLPHRFHARFAPKNARAVLREERSVVHVYMYSSNMQMFHSVVLFVSYAMQYRMLHVSFSIRSCADPLGTSRRGTLYRVCINRRITKP